jgi:hypothetical protein
MIFGTFIFISGCTKMDNFSKDGYYSGYFSYQGETKFDALSIDGNNYAEVPSGGAFNQKFPCLTRGTYKIKGNSITFTPSVLPDCLCNECILQGVYDLIQSDQTIRFQKGTGNDLQIYNVTLIEANR